MPDLFDYAARVPFSNPTTSKEAANSVRKDAHRLGGRVLDIIKAKPSTCDEIERMTGISHQTTSARIRQLALAGEVKDSGDKRPTSSGRRAIVWQSAR